MFPLAPAGVAPWSMVCVLEANDNYLLTAMLTGESIPRKVLTVPLALYDDRTARWLDKNNPEELFTIRAKHR